MGKRAVIYVRTSSEQQAEKCSPVEQENDCRQFAEKQGLVVVNVYRDVERYRFKNKWVEPSGTRYDRPGLLAMLRDAADDQFDVILAWREDRLYRGMRSMLLVLEAIQQNNLTIMLALESFDLATAPLKAWLAQLELDNIKERMTMGVKARLRAGKANSGQDRYGYRRVGEKIEIIPEEAEWVNQIFAWHANGVSIKSIRKQLIEANAPQKVTTALRRIHWSYNSIKNILASGEAYTSGVKIQKREGEEFSVQVPPILDIDLYQRDLEKRKKHTHSLSSVGIPRDDFLIRGYLFCPCQYKMRVRIPSSTGKAGPKRNQKFSRKYDCTNKHDELISADCPRSIDSAWADLNVWNQVCGVINDPEILFNQARAIVNEINNHANDLNADQERIAKELDILLDNRQWVITQARKGGISVTDMDRQLSEMSQREVELKRELSSASETIDPNSLENWETHLNQFLLDLQEGILGLGRVPKTSEEKLELNKLKRKVIETLVEKVEVNRSLEFKVTIRLNLLHILEDRSDQGGKQGSGGNWPSGSAGGRSHSQLGKNGFKASVGLVRISTVFQS